MPDPNETYDARRCRCCGKPWEEHTADCLRHAYRPPMVPAWLVAARAKLDHAANGKTLTHP